jgi:hypothetical protein
MTMFRTYFAMFAMILVTAQLMPTQLIVIKSQRVLGNS